MKTNIWLLLLAMCWPLFATAQFVDEEPLSPDQAFQLSAYALDAQTLRAEWDIAEGYYLYREKFEFSVNENGIVLGEGSYPKGKLKEDEFMGKIESYRHKVSIDIPITREPGSLSDFELTTVSQGCADMGLCYPPQTKLIKVSMPPLDEQNLSALSNDARIPSLLDRISQSLGLSNNQKSFLLPDEAFVFSAEVIDGNHILVRWDIADGYYLYRDKFSFSLGDVAGLATEGWEVGTPHYPPGKEKVDEAFGNMVVYYHEVALTLPIGRTSVAAKPITLHADFQGCADDGFCYPPATKTTALSLPMGSVMSAMAVSQSAADNHEQAAPFVSEQDTIANTLVGSSLWVIIASFFGFGLLLAFTPCVFPMVPILSSIIVGQGNKVTSQRALMISIVYVLAMALTYTVAGVIAGLFGQNLQAAFQNPWILSLFSGVFVLLALSMFGFYELQMPAVLQSKLTAASHRQQGGKLSSVAVMGFLSALIVGPCVAAPLAGALIYIGQTGDAVLGGVALFMLSLGMGVPLLVIGASAGKLLPKAGPWMDAIKAVFGVMLLAVAIWMLERIIPATAAMFLWAVLFIVSAIYLGAMTQLTVGASGWQKLWKGTGLVMLIYGAFLLAGAAAGGGDMRQPLRNVMVTSSDPQNNLGSPAVTFKRIKSIAELDAEVAKASALNKPVLVDFYADWCVSCKEMEHYTFSDPNVRHLLADVVLLQADVTANDDIDQALLKRYGLIGPPSILFFNTQGQEQKAYRLVGFLAADEFVKHTQRAFALLSNQATQKVAI